MFEDAFDSVIEQDFAVAYLRLLGKMYYKQITVTKLVDTAGYGRATFYGYFRGLRDLRAKLREYDFDKTEKMFALAASTRDISERQQVILKHIREHLKYFWPLMSENNVTSYIVAMKQCIKDIFKDRFCAKFAGWKFDAELIEDFYVSGVLRMMVDFYTDSGGLSPASDVTLAEFIDYALFVSDKNTAEESGI